MYIIQSILYFQYFQIRKDSNNNQIACADVMDMLTQLKYSDRYVNSFDDCLYTENDKNIYHINCCVACKTGQWLDPSVNSCSDCPAGSQCQNTVDEPQLCPPGTYQPDSKKTTCIDCPIGKLCDDYGFTQFEECLVGYLCEDPSSPEVCERGKFCLNGTAENCPSGTYSEDGQAECEECPDGLNCEDPSSIQPCEPGTFCKNGFSKKCPPGTMATEYGQTECYECPDGVNCADPSAPFECSAGKYADSTNTGCLPCPIGNYCQKGISEPCPAGTLANITGLDECKKCPRGANCADPKRPVQCPSGQYPNAWKIACSNCRAGHYCIDGIMLTCQKGKDCGQEGLGKVNFHLSLDGS